MPEFLTLLAPDNARSLLYEHLPKWNVPSESITPIQALDRVTSEDIVAPHPLPDFRRTTVDGYAVRAQDTFGASESLPALLTVTAEIPMGEPANTVILPTQAALIHTGGMLPEGANAVVMLEFAQEVSNQIGNKLPKEIEVFRPVSVGENVIEVGEDVSLGQIVIHRGTRIRPAEIGGLLGLGITNLRVATKPRVGIISTGDEIVDPDFSPSPGQVRDINSYTLSALVQKNGGQPVMYGIFPDKLEALLDSAKRGISECDLLLITAGSSASIRDMTADAINMLGKPGVLVHGINTKPGKPTIMGVCDGKAVLGLPGNPVSALVNGILFVVPLIERMLGLPEDRPRNSVPAVLAVNLSSIAGREDWWPVKLKHAKAEDTQENKSGFIPGWQAEPIFGKSNLIFSLSSADGLIKIPADATGLAAGAVVEVVLI